MNVLIVHAHPEPASFNGAMTRVAVEVLTGQGHIVTVSDLYALEFHAASDRSNFATVAEGDYFKPQTEEVHASQHGGFAPDLEAEITKLEACDLLIFQFPIWWFGLPAILKGWVDRVFAMGRTYGGDRIFGNGVFKGKRALLSLSTGGPAAAYAKGGFQGDIHAILRPIQRGMLQFVGFEVLAPQIVNGPVRLDQTARTALIEQYAERLLRIEAEPPYLVGMY